MVPVGNPIFVKLEVSEIGIGGMGVSFGYGRPADEKKMNSGDGQLFTREMSLQGLGRGLSHTSSGSSPSSRKRAASRSARALSWSAR